MRSPLTARAASCLPRIYTLLLRASIAHACMMMLAPCVMCCCCCVAASGRATRLPPRAMLLRPILLLLCVNSAAALTARLEQLKAELEGLTSLLGEGIITRADHDRLHRAAVTAAVQSYNHTAAATEVSGYKLICLGGSKDVRTWNYSAVAYLKPTHHDDTPLKNPYLADYGRIDDGVYTTGDLFFMLSSYVAGNITLGWTPLGGVSATNGEASYGAYAGQEPHELIVMCQAMVRYNNGTHTI